MGKGGGGREREETTNSPSLRINDDGTWFFHVSIDEDFGVISIEIGD